MYKILDRESAINKIIDDFDVVCVSGGFFGDEAKGKTVAELSNFVDVLARVNSGENAGHTVYFNNRKLVFHLVPSGVITGKPTFIGANCVMDPINFFEKEISVLKEVGFDYSNLLIGNVYVVHPLHKIVDLMRNPNASTGKGMSAVHQDVKGKRAVKIEDFVNKNFTNLRKSLDFWMKNLESDGHGRKKILDALSGNEKIPEHVKHFFDKENVDEMIKYLDQEISNLLNNGEFPKIGDPKAEMTKVLGGGGKVLLEGSQSFFLSNEEGTHYSSSTSAVTDTSGIFSSSGLSSKFRIITINVAKVPSSRVGSGANPSGYVEQDWFSEKNLWIDDLKKININFDFAYKAFINSIQNGHFINKDYLLADGDKVDLEGKTLKLNEALAISSCLKFGEFGATTGKPRVCGSFDLLHLAHVVKYQGELLSISCIDRLDGLAKVSVIVAYEYNGEDKQSNGTIFKKGDLIKINNELPNEEILKNCEPVYEILEGWQSSKADSSGNLDKNLGIFFDFIENKTGAKIISFGNGPETEDIVYVERV